MSSKMDFSEALDEMLSHCMYREDIEALHHFVFHPRHNGHSNVCNACQYAVGDERDWANDVPPDLVDGIESQGHQETCAYLQAARRVAPRGALKAWMDKA